MGGGGNGGRNGAHRQFPARAACGGADRPRGGGDQGAGGFGEARDEGRAFRAGAGRTAPQAEFAIGREGTANRGEPESDGAWPYMNTAPPRTTIARPRFVRKTIMANKLP